MNAFQPNALTGEFLTIHAALETQGMLRSTQATKLRGLFRQGLVGFLSSIAGLTVAGSSLAATITIDDAGDPDQTLNGAVFGVLDIKAAGSGHVDSFLRIQEDTEESGYNSDTSDSGFPDFNQKTGSFTHSITLGSIGTHILDSTNYLWFVIDLNEPNNQDEPLINLTELKILVGPDPDVFLDGDESKLVTNPVGGPTWDLVYDLDSNEDNTAILADMFSGSGTTDISLSIAASNFAGQGAGEYLYLWAKFTDSAGGFEEFIARTPGSGEGPIPGPGIPEPSSFLLAVLGSIALFRMKGRDRRFHA
jgi:hypothetical protein